MSHFKVCFFMLYHRKAITQFPPLGRVASYLEFRDKALTGILNTTHALCGELVPCQSSSSSSAQDKDNLKISFYQMVGERFHCHLLSHFSWTEGGHMEVIANAFPNSRPWVKHPRPVIPARMFHCLRKTSVRVKLVDSSWLRALGSSILSAITVSTKYNLQRVCMKVNSLDASVSCRQDYQCGWLIQQKYRVLGQHCSSLGVREEDIQCMRTSSILLSKAVYIHLRSQCSHMKVIVCNDVLTLACHRKIIFKGKSAKKKKKKQELM